MLRYKRNKKQWVSSSALKRKYFIQSNTGLLKMYSMFTFKKG